MENVNIFIFMKKVHIFTIFIEKVYIFIVIENMAISGYKHLRANSCASFTQGNSQSEGDGPSAVVPQSVTYFHFFMDNSQSSPQSEGDGSSAVVPRRGARA